MRFRILCRRPAPRPAQPQLPAQTETRPDVPSAAGLDNPYSPLFSTPRSREQLLLRRRD